MRLIEAAILSTLLSYDSIDTTFKDKLSVYLTIIQLEILTNRSVLIYVNNNERKVLQTTTCSYGTKILNTSISDSSLLSRDSPDIAQIIKTQTKGYWGF